LAAVQDELLQQFSLAPPQVAQAPFEQVPESGLGQVLPLAVQKPPTQHPLFEQALPAQQIWPAPPHVGAASAVSTATALSATAAASMTSMLVSS
jgi:hypothetical protein